MAKNDFDFDFDFEKEFNSDSDASFDSDFNDMDLSELDGDNFDMDMMDEAEEDAYDEFDLDALDLDQLMQGDEAPSDEDFAGGYESGVDYGQDAYSADLLHQDAVYASEPDAAYDDYDPQEDEEDAEQYDDYDEFDDDFAEDDFEEEAPLMDFSRRASFFGGTEQEAAPQYEEPAYSGEAREEDAEAPAQEEPQQEQQDTVDETETELERNSRQRQRERREQKEKKESKDKKLGLPVKLNMPEVKLGVPPILVKLFRLYFPTKEMLEPPVDPNNPRRRKKKSKAQMFKEAYLPAILACLTLILMLSFVVGSISNAIKQKKLDNEAAKESSISAANQAELIKSEAENLLEAAAIQAQGYDYDGAITTLNSFSGDKNEFPEIVAALSEYMNTRDTLVEFNSPSTIPNLSFHVLIADPARAFADKDYGGLYNRNFVTTDEFQRILEQLYKNNYILVDFDSFVSGTTDLEGNASFFSVPIQLPEGKKPVMITETMVNYFNYMIDGNQDNIPDAGGDGFASKLVVDANGDIKAEYVDINSQTQVGNYDLVPILEEFIKQHPDFSYRGARATLAVTGYEGVFGWRCNTTYIASVGQAYYDEQVKGAKEVVEALRSKGYRIASYSYKNEDYGQLNANQIQADLTLWNDQITPILGQVDTIVFAKNSDIRDYSGPKFNVLYTSGFRVLVTNGEQPYAEVNNTYVRQTRLMVTGNAMAWKSAQFTNLSLFDPNIVLDMTSRKQVPN